MCDMCGPCVQASLGAWATHGLARPIKPAYYYKSMIGPWGLGSWAHGDFFKHLVGLSRFEM
ncbi:hypothetical protein GIB67_016949 [Kingdonia uniflora]|uniref:Uncharacterized protein n=1 Tax=Kingdonia uniflora TaxID=39325 RepID=A0A7J7M3E9_9MAGN|nr:hypothetical protein GIB67_016949 [Kingdonia uniflora]